MIVLTVRLKAYSILCDIRVSPASIATLGLTAELRQVSSQMPVEAPAIIEMSCIRCGKPMPGGTYWCPSCGKLNASRHVRIVFVLFVLAIFAGVAVTRWYVSYLRDLELSLAQRWFARGDEAMAKNYPAVAVEDYRNGLGYAANNQQYRLKLAEALQAEGRLPESRAYLLSLWSLDPASATINLDLARLYGKEGKLDLATRYYRMAIDGVWSDNPIQRRNEIRLELVNFFAQQGDRSRATAELITLQAEAPDDLQVQLQIADLLLKFDEYSRAAKVYDGILKDHANDVQALTGAGQAALALGDYRKAVGVLTRANQLAGDQPGSLQAERLAVAREAQDADPYLRILSLAQRAARVAAAFDFAMERLRQCATQQQVALGPESPSSLATRSAKSALPGRQNGHVTPIIPPAGPPNPLQLLYDSGLQRQSSATREALHKNPDNLATTMDFVFEALRETEGLCPLRTPREQALDLIARQEAHEPR
jgi:tetratricopeptide (TPR) repeat protein